MRKVLYSQSRSVSSANGMAAVAGALSTTGISRRSLQANYSAQSLLHRAFLSVKPQAFASAISSLLNAKNVDFGRISCNTLIVGGAEDVYTAPENIRAWSREIAGGHGRDVILRDVGHWSAAEAPREVGDLLDDWDAM
jgi:pimeloyl-ACP methyl ester carboxylesterase